VTALRAMLWATQVGENHARGMYAARVQARSITLKIARLLMQGSVVGIGEGREIRSRRSDVSIII
jgi:hypothetical protein